MNTQNKDIDRTFVIPDIWMRRFNSFLPLQNYHPCNKTCDEPCKECIDVAGSLTFLAEVVIEQDYDLSQKFRHRAKDYDWSNGSPPPNDPDPPPLVANLMPVPQSLTFINAVSKKRT